MDTNDRRVCAMAQRSHSLKLVFIIFLGTVIACQQFEEFELGEIFSLGFQETMRNDEEDIEIISDIYMRDAINFKTSFCFTKLTTDLVEEVVNEINRI